MAAFSLIELMFVLGVAATLASATIPQVSSAIDEYRAAGAARYVASRLQQARVRAITRSRDTALRITRDTRGFVVSVYEDGNRNGVLSRDIQDGVDSRRLSTRTRRGPVPGSGLRRPAGPARCGGERATGRRPDSPRFVRRSDVHRNWHGHIGESLSARTGADAVRCSHLRRNRPHAHPALQRAQPDVVLPVTSPGERRRARRVPLNALRNGLTGRIRPGHPVRVLDMSSCGVLIETGRRLVPGMFVELHLEVPKDARPSGRRSCAAMLASCCRRRWSSGGRWTSNVHCRGCTSWRMW